MCYIVLRFKKGGQSLKQSFFTVDVLFSGTVLSVLFSGDFLENCITADPRMHKHTKYELHYIETGYCVLQTASVRTECSAGHILIIPPSVEHLLHYTPQTKTKTLLFTPGELGTKSTLLSALLTKTPLLIKDDFKGLSRLSCVRELFKMRELASEEHARGEMTRFFADLAAAILPQKQSCAFFFKENREEEIDAYISRNCLSSKCSCESLAKHLNLSIRQTHRICIEYYGVPFRTLLYRTRMDIAKYRLEHSGASVSELAEQIGYSSPSAFSAAYKRHFGKAPTSKK